MQLPKFLFRSLIVFVATILLGGVSLSAQERAGEASYEATLYVLVGSDDASQRADLPRALDPVSKQIRDSFSFRNYRLMNTYYGRLANSGSLEYKSVSSLKNSSTELDSPSFLEWQLAKFQTEPTAAGNHGFGIEVFRFGARVPVPVSSIKGPDGSSVPVTNYESVGLTLNKLRLNESKPTLIGTISLPRTTGTIFLVMTIAPVS